ncbi:MAG: 3,4-dihydroxy-2-butanone-4-phosphate synthase [Phycisphaerales bacterium]
MALSPIPDILDDLRAGKMVILVDDENRENEGDFVCAAEMVTPEVVNFMTRIGAGYLCVAMTGADCDRLDLKPQAQVNTSIFATPFTVTVDGSPRHGVSTGVSSSDRAATIRLLGDPNTTVDDFVRPGHINPLRSRDGGVLVRTGQTEGSVDLCRLAGLRPAAAIIEIVLDSGEMARMPDLETIAAEHGIKMCSVEQIIEHRLRSEGLVQRLDPRSGTTVELPEGTFNLVAWDSAIDPVPHLALCVGGVGDLDEHGIPVVQEQPTLVRMHRRDLLGDVFLEAGNPSGQSLRTSLRMIQEEGRGAVVYLRPEGHGADLAARLQRIRRPRREDEVNVPDLTDPQGVSGRAQPMDRRDFGIGGQLLRDLGLRDLRIITNRPKTLRGLSGFGLDVVEQVPFDVSPAR